jgi:hypothetical protein
MTKQLCEISASSWFYYKEILSSPLIGVQNLIQYDLVINRSDKSHYGAAGASVTVIDKTITWNF